MSVRARKSNIFEEFVAVRSGSKVRIKLEWKAKGAPN